MEQKEEILGGLNAHELDSFTRGELNLSQKGWMHVSLPSSLSVAEALECLREVDEFVCEAEPNYLFSVDVVPNDPYFVEQWGLHNTGQTGGTPDADIDAPEAWELRTDASSVVVAVIDTGVDYAHVDLAANM